MYPIARLLKEVIKHGRSPIGLTDIHRSSHLCWPWDLDLWMELNNGRTLTLYDLGRLPFLLRCGLIDLLRNAGCTITVAGANVRYRHRIRLFQRIEMATRLLGWDDRFFYLEQSMRCGERVCNHIVLRLAATSKTAGGIIPPRVVMKQGGDEDELNAPPLELPDWVVRWSQTESMRPWPPELTRG